MEHGKDLTAAERAEAGAARLVAHYGQAMLLAQRELQAADQAEIDRLLREGAVARVIVEFPRRDSGVRPTIVVVIEDGAGACHEIRALTLEAADRG
jgi:hypothetical protein